MSGAVEIRPLDREQIAACIDGFIAVARDVPEEYWREQHFLLDLPEKWILSLAAWRGAVPVGYAILSRKSSETAHLHHFMISADQRRSGLGTRLLTAAIERCRQHYCAEMSLKVAAWSADARRFYQRHGFGEIGSDGNYKTMRRRFL